MRVNKKKRKTSEVLLHVNCIKANELSRGKWPSMRFSLILVGFGIDVFNRLSISLGKLRVAPTLRCRSRKGDLIWDPNRRGNYKLDTE